MANIGLVTADNFNGGAARATRRIAKGLTAISLRNSFNFELVCNGLPEVGYIQKSPYYKWYTDFFYRNSKMYISANGDTSKYPAKILVDNTAVAIGSELYKMKQENKNKDLNKDEQFLIKCIELDNLNNLIQNQN